MTNAASRKEVRKLEKLAEAARVREAIINREVISGLMSVANGREWVWNRLDEAGFSADGFHPDAAIHAYNAGTRKFAMRLFNDIMLYAPEQFNVMIGEAHERSTIEQRTRSEDAGGRDQGPIGGDAVARTEPEPGGEADSIWGPEVDA